MPSMLAGRAPCLLTSRTVYTMYELCRAVRFCVDHTSPGGEGLPGYETLTSVVNGYAGTPSLTGLGRYEQFDVRCVGPVDPTLAYLVDIKVIDRAVRRAVAPIVAEALRRSVASSAKVNLPLVLTTAGEALRLELGGILASLRWRLTPYLSLETIVNDARPSASSAPSVLFRQRFEFAASHRLHVPSLSIEENRRAFGKCNHANGHGHNYIFEPCVEVPVSAAPSQLSVQGLEHLCKEVLLDRYDHTYLNVDTPEFDAERGGVVPSVENIAKVFFDRLAPKIAEAGGGRLVQMTVWESDRTSASYPSV